MRLVNALLLIVLLTPAVLAESDDSHAGHRFKDAAEWAEDFDAPERFQWQKPITVMVFLGMEEGMKVADIGAGTGYFTRLFSSGVGESGRLYAVDIEQQMLDYIRNRDDIETGDNIEYILAEPDDPKLPEGELDLILIVNTWHHVEKRVPYLAHLEKSLRPGRGRVAIIDWHKHDLPMGPPRKMKLGRDRVVSEFEKAGWTLRSESVALPYQYFLVFSPDP